MGCLKIEVLEEFAAAQAFNPDRHHALYAKLAYDTEKKLESRREWGRSWRGKIWVRAYRRRSLVFQAAKKRRAAKYRAAHKAQRAEYMRKWRLAQKC